MSIRDRHQRVLERIARAGLRSGNQGVRLVVVTKSQPVEVVREAVAAGVKRLGESYADEAVKKIAALGNSAVEWHMIGHVQSRKAGLVAANFVLLHALDSEKLAARLDRFCTEARRVLPVLVEINVSGEASKYGLPGWDEARWPELLPVLANLNRYPGLRVCGLMTMPPFFERPELARPYFRKLKILQGFLEAQLPQIDLGELSMGTSADFETAIEEGATIVRVGQAILGPRPSHQALT